MATRRAAPASAAHRASSKRLLAFAPRH
ncbi:hypothetical protein A2U01_0107947, partial [Trifolium medium]|nr:hypothetical protein [Trifolium medium]